ncbi:MAG: hypothetical protein K2I91_01985, partial [Muribaculaceae bacterium]|nr:hypothetical protein [Muribaculaceae bacterium]
RLAEARSWVYAGGKQLFIFEMRLLDALSWHAEIWKISIVVRIEATVDALCEYDCTHHNSREVSARCPFYYDGHSRASASVNGQQYGSRAFLFYVYQLKVYTLIIVGS